jgi:hypothetical protein
MIIAAADLTKSLQIRPKHIGPRRFPAVKHYISFSADRSFLGLALVSRGIAARFPDDVLDMLFGVGSEIFSETQPMETPKTTPQVEANPVFARLNSSSAHNADVDF